MCGFYGLVNWNGIDAGHERSNLLRSIARRGPDDHGLVTEAWFEAAHTRLSIQDLSWRGHQPFQDQSGRFLTVYNGEIYNFREINNNLTKNGITFRTGADTETLIENFSLKNISAFSDFHGMFSGAIFDREEKAVYLFRDRLGVKPLYYSQQGAKLAFGSTPKVVSDLMGGLPTDKSQFMNYLAFRTADTDKSMFVGVNSLRPGTVLKCSSSHIEQTTFWDVRDYINAPHTDLTEDEVIYQLRLLLEQAVDKRLVADVPVGAFLSGGLDSTIVVHHMAAKSGTPVRAHTFTSLLDSDDETARAQRTADFYRAKCEIVDITYENYLDDLSLLTKTKGSPLCVPNEYAIFKMSQKMKPTNTVVLSGEGSDEIFWGYSNIFTSGAEAINITRPHDIARWIFDRYKYVSPETLLQIGYDTRFSTSYIENGVSYILGIMNELGHGSLTDHLQYFFLRHHLPSLLMRLDNATMAASIEGRAPFTDHRLVEFALTIPARMKLGAGEGGTSGKRILYKAYNDLPGWVVKTPKIGFKIGDTLRHRSEFTPLLNQFYPRAATWFDDGSVPPMQKWHLTMLSLFASNT